MDLSSGLFWAALGEIIFANIILSGDNAVVIAMASRTLPPKQQRRAIVWGSAAAILMRIVLTVAAVEMLRWPYLKIVGALLLVYIGVSLLTGDNADEAGHRAGATLMVAIRTILVADLVMSLDNVLAVAAAAKGNTLLLVISLVVSIPLIVFGSTLLLKVMERFPIIITLGAAMLGYLAGEMLITDPAVVERFGAVGHATELLAGAVGVVLVVGLGMALRRRGSAQRASSASSPSL